MFPTLFSPLTIKRLTLKNRIASTPHSDGMAEDGLVTERLIAYFRAKAVGGAGLVMDLDRAAIEAVKTWLFEPARRGKEPVPVWVTLPVRFGLTSQ